MNSFLKNSNTNNLNYLGNSNVYNLNSMNIGGGKKKPGDDLHDYKKVTFTDVDKNSEFPSEFHVQHEYSNNSNAGNPNFQNTNGKSPLIFTHSETSYDGSAPITNKNRMSLKKNLNVLNKLSDEGMKRLWEEAHKPGNFSFKATKEGQNQNNLNMLENLNMITNVNEIAQDNPPAGRGIGPTSKSYLTYIDVKHPKTKKIIDRNKGTITTVVDMGNVDKTVILDPKNTANYDHVEHRLDDHFLTSDYEMHFKTEPNKTAYKRPFGSLDMGGWPKKNKGYTNSTVEGDKETTNYKYESDFSLRSSKPFAVKSVQTKDPDGINLNGQKFEYGKTINGQTNGNRISLTQQAGCCSIEPCIYLPKCESSLNEIQPLQKDSFSFLEMQSTEKQSRSRSRYPNEQFKCVESRLNEILDYLCDEEIPPSFTGYCKALRKQIHVAIESLLYHDKIIDICSSINLCR